MAERPILFSAPMVRALLAGTKTQTRRVVKGTGLYAIDAAIHGAETAARELLALASRCPYGQAGGRLWVRETWRERVPDQDGRTLDYRADHASEDPCDLPWRPSIHMPRAASRINLEVTEARVERLQAITMGDAMAEGLPWRQNFKGFCLEDGSHFHAADPRQAYFSLWEAINGPGSVEANPWVWCVAFKRVAA